MPDPGPRKTKQHRVDGVLNNLKTRTTVDEHNLKEVLVGGRNKTRSQRDEAQKLLDEVLLFSYFLFFLFHSFPDVMKQEGFLIICLYQKL